MNFDGLDVTTGCMPCKTCQRRNGCKEDCGATLEDECPCRTVCVECSAWIERVVRSVRLLRAEQQELL